MMLLWPYRVAKAECQYCPVWWWVVLKCYNDVFVWLVGFQLSSQ